MDIKDKLKGIYAITPPKFDETKLLNDINICLGWDKDIPNPL